MALIWQDGFDHYAIGEIDERYDIVSTTGAILSAPGVYSYGQCFRPAQDNYIQKTVAAGTTFVVGFHYSPTTLADSRDILRIYDGATLQLTVNLVVTSGLIRIARGDGTQLAISTNAFTAGSWRHIEFKFTINNSTGSVELRVDGVNWASASSVDTQNSANATCDTIMLYGKGGYGYFDNFYILDSAAGANDFLGECRIETLRPSGAGNYTQFTPSAGANYTCVDETLVNSDTDYVASSTPAQRDSYAFGDMTLTGVIVGLQLDIFARKDDAGARALQIFTRLGTTDYDGANVHAMLSGYDWFHQLWLTDPSTSAAWLIAAINAAEFGTLVNA